ncbi:DNA-directed RNA polymerase II subunit RPB4-like [Convolutriloba macropyga]|uniref:DNA-directed RNA polymerase II subunit RPB4-like n=1 Tax=Convolutriloba macropyga TaxID=536237 RepID=UPI003F51B7EC
MSDEGITLSSSTKGGHSANVQHTNTGPTTSQSTEVVEDASELLFPDEFKDAQALLIAEVYSLMKMNETARENDNEFQLPNEVFAKTLAYTDKFARFKKHDTINAVRNHLMTKKLHKYEIAALANLCPDTAEEACALIPSLETRFEERELEAILTHIQSLISYDK